MVAAQMGYLQMGQMGPLHLPHAPRRHPCQPYRLRLLHGLVAPPRRSPVLLLGPYPPQQRMRQAGQGAQDLRL